ncbi:unnamed protein product [Phytophthora fragariaefolia]|uniref:Unnamed protein product n=1 Tax=Phytophthora fragariaefolia TaxID=1490495 RepID=A0A9W6WXN3_9STRA|nr:unnamed protein product [Phytophthora fragariaefolia]
MLRARLIAEVCRRGSGLGAARHGDARDPRGAAGDVHEQLGFRGAGAGGAAVADASAAVERRQRRVERRHRAESSGHRRCGTAGSALARVQSIDCLRAAGAVCRSRDLRAVGAAGAASGAGAGRGAAHPYLARVSKPEAAPAPLDRAAQCALDGQNGSRAEVGVTDGSLFVNIVDEVMKLNSLCGRLTGKKNSSTGKEVQQERSFFDPAPVKTVEDGKAYLRRLQKAQKQKEAEESMQSASAYGMEDSYQSDAFGIYGNASMVPRVYQASGFDPHLRDVSIGDEEEDPLRTSSLPHIAWQQLEDWGLAMFMHLYCRNIRRLLAYHVKDVVEAFLENANALNECGVMADVLLRRVPSQALLCPPGQTNQMTNVSLSDMLQNLAKSPLFFSKERGKYLNVGDPSSTDYSSLERQQYVLERLIMLSKDRSLDRFRWNKGSAWKGKEWTESLPTDAEILMNTFCCMMDNMLPADNERDRPFWKSYYFSKGPNRPFTPRVRSRLFLVQTVGRPPHFKALVKGAVREIVPVR